jgi:hypothetical protein
MNNEQESCCDHEDNHVERDECVICHDCKEWTSEIECKECGETLSKSACCG